MLDVTDDESHPVKRMIRGLGVEMTSTYSQTLNWVRSSAYLTEARAMTDRRSTKWAIFGKQNWRCGMNQTSS